MAIDSLFCCNGSVGLFLSWTDAFALLGGVASACVRFLQFHVSESNDVDDHTRVASSCRVRILFSFLFLLDFSLLSVTVRSVSITTFALAVPMCCSQWRPSQLSLDSLVSLVVPHTRESFANVVLVVVWKEHAYVLLSTNTSLCV